MELDRVRSISIIFFIVTILCYYGFMQVMSGVSLSMLVDGRFLELAKHTYVNVAPFLIIYLGSIAAVFIDYSIKQMVGMRQFYRRDDLRLIRELKSRRITKHGVGELVPSYSVEEVKNKRRSRSRSS